MRLAPSKHAARHAQLRYCCDDVPGLRRVRRGKSFRYLDGRGRPARARDLARIESLVIPPAWEDVWISPHANGHLQATVTADGPEVAYMGPRDTAVVRAFTTTIRRHGATPHLRVKTGTSDMNIVGPIWKCPIVAYGPGDSRLDHTPNEHISIPEYHKAIEVLTAVIERVAKEL